MCIAFQQVKHTHAHCHILAEGAAADSCGFNQQFIMKQLHTFEAPQHASLNTYMSMLYV